MPPIMTMAPTMLDSVALKLMNGYKHSEAGPIAMTPPRPQDSMFSLKDCPVENLRPVKIVVIGAGYSGIYCGIRIPEKIRDVELVIYDKNPGIGGTWFENRYPGCACDVPSHSYQYSFEPNLNWSSLYAPASEIRDYLKHTAHKYGAHRFIKLSHQVTRCSFDEGSGKWHVDITNLTTGVRVRGTADILISGRGNLNAISWPKIDGLRDFKGELMHSARWNEEYDFRNKKKLSGTRLSCFIRSPTWISPPFGQPLWDTLGIGGYKMPEDLKTQFQNDPIKYHEFRLAVEEGGNSMHGASMRGTTLQTESQKLFKENMTSKLSARPDILTPLLPTFSPGCRRLTPGIGFLEALTEENVDFVATEISRIAANGVHTQDGKFHEVDALVCATGFQTGAAPPFPVIGQNSIPLHSKWKERPSNYLSLAVDEFPNHFMMLGPNSAIGSGSLTMMIEATGDYVVKCIRKIQKENIKSMTVKSARVRDLTAYTDAYFDKTVYREQCHSWYQKKGKVIGLWPGSTLHYLEALRSPRWEDYDYEYIDEDRRGEEANRMAWLGNGWSLKQQEGRDLAWYLYPEFQELPAVETPEDGKRFKIRPFSH